ncbi:MAG: glycoside hydrolase family 13 protein [Clostridia bacterium]|nr:glycoside hydrolase family 13 protein [Clostridia bacterium]
MLTLYHDSRSEYFRIPFGAVPDGTAVRLFLDCYEDDLASTKVIAGVSVKLRIYGTENDPAGGGSVAAERTVAASPVTRCQKDTDYGRRIYSRYEADFVAERPGVIFYSFRVHVADGGGFDGSLGGSDGSENGGSGGSFGGSDGSENGGSGGSFGGSENGGTVYSYGNNRDLTGGVGETAEGGDVPPYQITVYRKDLKVPDWFKNSIIYQIFPDRFAKGIDAMTVNKPDSFMYGTWDDLPMYIKDADNNILRWDFYGGNLSGISGKLPYIEALGADVIYLNPIFESVSNHRYDTSDYMHVDGLLGGDAAFSLLKFVCERSNIKLILDGVFSHTGSDSVYFDKKHKYGGGAYGNRDSKYRSWYRFSEESDDVYDCWWGVKVMPNVNETDPGYMEFIASGEDSVVRKNLREGASGFRLDVADELPDEFIRALRAAADETALEVKYAPVVIGEVWEDATNKWSYGKLRSYFTEPELHSVTNYPFRKTLLSYFKGEISADRAAAGFLSMKENYPAENFYALANMTGSHDVTRLMTEMMGASEGRRAAAARLVYAYAAVMFTFPGVPLVYYGDETLLEGGEDPDNRRTYPWGREDLKSITLFAELAAIRRKYNCLVEGDITFVPGAFNSGASRSGDVFAFLRTLGSQQLLTVVSRSGEVSSNVSLKSSLPAGSSLRLVKSFPGTPETVSVGGSGAIDFEMKGSFALYEVCE